MYYDEKKGRYIIEGEDESDDDVPPPPPPKKQVLDQSVIVEEEKKKEEEPAITGADSLTKVAFGGALANRGRGRGIAMNRFAPAFNSEQISTPSFEPPKVEINESLEVSALYTTTLDVTMNDTVIIKEDK